MSDHLAIIDKLRQERDAFRTRAIELERAASTGPNYCDKDHAPNWHDDEYCPVCEYRRVVADLRADVERLKGVVQMGRNLVSSVVAFQKSIEDWEMVEVDDCSESYDSDVSAVLKALSAARNGLCNCVAEFDAAASGVERLETELYQEKHCPMCDYKPLKGGAQ